MGDLTTQASNADLRRAEHIGPGHRRDQGNTTQIESPTDSGLNAEHPAGARNMAKPVRGSIELSNLERVFKSDNIGSKMALLRPERSRNLDQEIARHIALHRNGIDNASDAYYKKLIEHADGDQKLNKAIDLVMQGLPQNTNPVELTDEIKENLLRDDGTYSFGRSTALLFKNARELIQTQKLQGEIVFSIIKFALEMTEKFKELSETK